MPKSIASFSASRLIFFSIVVMIALGTTLLSLPMCQAEYVSLIDTFFTAVSAICVCGLTTVPISYFTFIGHCVLLVLMQIGGLSLVTLTFFLMSLFMKMGFRTQLMAGQILELESWKKFRTMLFFIIAVTFGTEIIGACIFFFSLIKHFSLSQAIFLSIFHSVSLFCHTGFTIFHDAMEVFTDNYHLLIASSFIILIAGFGFGALYDIYEYLWHKRKEKVYYLSLHTKIVVTMTVILTISSCLLYWILEHHNTLAHMSMAGSIVNAIFNGICMRGAGFSTVFIPELQMATILIAMISSFIGSSPGSIGSGIKSTTVALLYGTIKATILGQSKVILFGRTIPKIQMMRAIAIFFLSLFWVLFVTFFLLITERGFSFIDIFFEAISSFATLGLSTGITPSLSTFGKLLISLTMIIGRLGPLGFLLAVQKRKELATEPSYPEERVILG